MQNRFVQGVAGNSILPRRSSHRARPARPGHLPRHVADGETLLATAIAGAKEGDVSALRFLYVRYADDVQGYVESIVRNRHEAEDLTQDVFAKLITAIARYERARRPSPPGSSVSPATPRSTTSAGDARSPLRRCARATRATSRPTWSARKH
jgi:Sigma-70 region 2